MTEENPDVEKPRIKLDLYAWFHDENYKKTQALLPEVHYKIHEGWFTSHSESNFEKGKVSRQESPKMPTYDR
jgi:hypothetical protein